MRDVLSRLGVFLRRSLLVAGGLAVCATGTLYFLGGRQSNERADCIVVFGAAVRKGRTPSDALQYRLEHALTLYRAKRAPTIIVTGGGEGGYAEAHVMADWLASRGVNRDTIIIDNDSETTRDSGQRVAAIMKERGMKSALVVSQWFHVARCRLVLEQAGVAQTEAAPCGGNTLRREPFFVAREMLGLPAYALHLDKLRG